MLSKLKLLFLAIIILSPFTAEAAKSISINAPDSAEQGDTVNITGTITDHQGEVYHIWITDCNNEPISKRSATNITSNNFPYTYTWNTDAAGTGICAHKVTVKTFTTSGTMTQMTDHLISITSAGTGGGGGTPSGPVHTRLGDFSSVPEYITAIYNKALPYGISLVILTIIWSGYILMTSAGNPEAATNAKNYIMLSLGGLLLLILARLVIDSIWAPL